MFVPSLPCMVVSLKTNVSKHLFWVGRGEWYFITGEDSRGETGWVGING